MNNNKTYLPIYKSTNAYKTVHLIAYLSFHLLTGKDDSFGLKQKERLSMSITTVPN